jgi:hypothetical protein
MQVLYTWLFEPSGPQQARNGQALFWLSKVQLHLCSVHF